MLSRARRNLMRLFEEKQLDDWRRQQDDLPGRPEAIRRLVEIGLRVKAK
jgi:hypothetical protein